MRRARHLALLLLAAVALSFALAVLGAFLPLSITPTASMIIVHPPGKEGAADGSVLVWQGRGDSPEPWGHLGGLRTDLLLDPGPYPLEQRRGMLATAAPPWPGPRLVPQQPTPPRWVRAIALEHAGPAYAGWQARVAAFGWPRPVLYWLWDWRTESLQGGATVGKAPPAAVPSIVRPSIAAIPEHALPWRIIPSGLLIDTAAFAGVVYVAVLLHQTTTRTLHRRAGRCARCGYDLAATATGEPCPECGKPSAAARSTLSAFHPERRARHALARAAARRLLLSLVLGLLTTVAVSWMLAAAGVRGGAGAAPVRAVRARDLSAWEGMGELRASRLRAPFGTHILIESKVLDDPSQYMYGATPTTVVATAISPEQLVDAWARDAALPWLGGKLPWPNPGGSARRAVRAVGWPLPALWHEYRWSTSPPAPRYATPGGLRLDTEPGDPTSSPILYPRALPFRPLWRGLLLDSALFTAAWYLLLIALSFLLRPSHPSQSSTTTIPTPPPQ